MVTITDKISPLPFFFFSLLMTGLSLRDFSKVGELLGNGSDTPFKDARRSDRIIKAISFLNEKRCSEFRFTLNWRCAPLPLPDNEYCVFNAATRNKSIVTWVDCYTTISP